jgi:subtilisin family serine protease
MKKIIGGELFFDGDIDTLVLASNDSMHLSIGSNTPADSTTFTTFGVERSDLPSTAWDATPNTQSFNFALSGYLVPPIGMSPGVFAAMRGPTADGALSQGVAFTALSELGFKAIGDAIIAAARPLQPDVSSASDVEIASQQDASLIHLNEFRADPRFAGIDGSGVSVVVIDTGIDRNHPFFGPDANHDGVDDRIIFSFDFSGANDSDASDTNGHGSNVASIIGSQDATYTGMAPGVNIIALKVFPDNNPNASSADISEALNWVVANYATYNIVAVNMSLGQGDNLNTPTNSAYHTSFVTLNADNVAVVAASGNSYFTYQQQGVGSPSADPNAWSVGAVYDRDVGAQGVSGPMDFTSGPDRIPAFSQRSATLSTIFAPGVQIIGANQSGGTVNESGTSQATPHISGLVADMQELALQVSGHLMSVASLRSTMVSSATNIVDGDDENDNVNNTGATFHRVDALAWGGAVLNLLFAGTAGADTLNGTAADDVIHGQGSDDILRGNGGNDTLFGDAGTDTAVFSGLFSAYTLSDLGGGSVRVSGPDGTDTLTSIERLQFSDQTIIWPVPGSISINDMTIAEGNSSTKLLTFTITRTGGTAAFDVNYATADNSATVADGDYVAKAGTLHFDANANIGLISVTINGDVKFESNETFFVNLSGTTNGVTISDGQGIGTISNDDPLFAASKFQLAAFAPDAGGWSNDTIYPRELADLNKDGFADIVGFGQSGVYVALGTGNGSFSSSSFKLAAFAPDAGGWSNDDRYPRELADVNKDGFADIVGFGENGVYVALGTGNGSFGAPSFKLAAFAPSAGGWNNDTTYPRELADVNNDGMADIVGFGQDGVYVALATGGGAFGAPSFKFANFAPGAGGWSNDDKYPRFLADVNGDHMADIVGFGESGVYVALATGGGSFGPSSFKLANFAPSAGGWINQTTYPRELADVNNDGMADIVGFGQDGVYVALATGGGAFGPSSLQLANFAPGAGGWSNDTLYPRHLADLNHDGAADIVGFGQSGVYDALNGFHLV